MEKIKNQEFINNNSVPVWNDNFKLIGGPYSVSNIQDCFNYVIKTHEPLTDNPPIKIYFVIKVHCILWATTFSFADVLSYEGKYYSSKRYKKSK